MAKIENEDIVQYRKHLKSIESQINNLTNAIAKGVTDDILIGKINALNETKKEVQKRIDEAIVKELPPVNEADVKKALSKFKQFVKENNNVAIKAFLNEYIEKIVVGKEKVEVTFKVASAFFNSAYPDDKNSKLLAQVEITREELKQFPKQHRKVPDNQVFGKDFLVSYSVVTT